MSTEKTGQVEAVEPMEHAAEVAPEAVAEPAGAEAHAEAAAAEAPESAAAEPVAAAETTAQEEVAAPAAAAPATEPAAAPLSETPADGFQHETGFDDGDGEGPATPEDAEPVAKGAKDEFTEIAKTIFYALLIALVLRVLFFQPFTIPSASMEPNLYEGDYIIVSKWNYGYSRHSIPFSPPVIKGRLFNTAPKRGDIVVFKLPRDNRTDYIKRVVGLPGDKIQVRNDRLFINGAAVGDQDAGPIRVSSQFGESFEARKVRETLPGGKTFMTQDWAPDAPADNTGVYTVPAGCYFMMGDNRDNSVDSRFNPGIPTYGRIQDKCGWDSSLDVYVPQQLGVGFVPAENLVGKADLILFSWTPGASLWKPWTWFTHLRPSRFFTVLK
jgi:signal peptidase I